MLNGDLSLSTDALSITYKRVPGPYSYELLCDYSNPPDSLSGCMVDLHTPPCTRKTAAGVICHGRYLTIPSIHVVNCHQNYWSVPEEKRCETGEVRLVNGSKLTGRLEICLNGVWGTVCKRQNWSRLHATVVCRQLGFLNDSESERLLKPCFLLCNFSLHLLSTYWSRDRAVWCWSINSAYFNSRCRVFG